MGPEVEIIWPSYYRFIYIEISIPDTGKSLGLVRIIPLLCLIVRPTQNVASFLETLIRSFFAFDG